MCSGRSDVRLVFLPSRVPLGALRNISVEHAQGDIICQWDDDDLSHSSRLGRQFSEMKHQGASVSYLREHLHLFAPERRLFWCDWVRAQEFVGMPGTLMAWKKVLPPYPARLSRNEDTVLQQEIARAGVRTMSIPGLAHLFLYTYQGGNSFPEGHHLRLAQGLSLERASLLERHELIASALEEYRIEPPVHVTDYLGQPVFSWPGPQGHQAEVSPFSQAELPAADHLMSARSDS